MMYVDVSTAVGGDASVSRYRCDQVTTPQILSDVLNTFLFATFLIFDVL